MNLFKNVQYDNSFIEGGNTAKPIAGTCTLTAYNKPLNQAKVTVDNMIQGSPVVLKNISMASSTNSNNDGLSGNVFTAETVTDKIDGFIVNSPNDVLLDGDTFPRFLKNQIVRVARIGSGATVYLPADASLSGVSISTPLKWDLNNNNLSLTNGVDLPGVKLAAQMVNGLIPNYDATNNISDTKDGLVVRVIL